MRQDVIEFFQNLPDNPTEQYNKAFELYKRSPDRNTAVERIYNAGFTKHNLTNLLYDLQKLHGIKDIEKLPAKVPVAQSEDTTANVVKMVLLSATEDERNKVLYALKLAADFPDFVVVGASETLKEFIETSTSVCTEFIDALCESQGVKKDDAIDELIKTLPDEIAAVQFPEEILTELTKGKTEEDPDISQGDPGDEHEDKSQADQTEQKSEKTEELKFRDEYPFLKEADCPTELKILATDKITAYNNYRDCHARLQEHKDGKITLNPEEEKQLAAAAVGWFEDGEAIKAELDHYRDNKEILGKHRIFKYLVMQREVDAMTQDELIKFQAQTPSYISKKNKGIETAKTEERKFVLNNAITDRNEKLALVNKKLGISAGK